jgi:TRAP-type C4-dicarboxylate transport system permease small subunit
VRAAHRRLQRALEGVVLALMLALALVVVVGVAFRKLGASLVWYDEVASILLAWLTYYGAALGALHRAHIRMPTLVDRAPRWARIAMVAVAEASVIGFFLVLSVLGGTTLVSLPWVPASVAQSVIPVGAVLFLAAELVTLPGVARQAWTGETPAGAPGGEDAA